MTFHVGQKVVCVDAGHHYTLKNGAIYTVARIDIEGLGLEETLTATIGGYFFRRFRPIVEKKTDISIFTEILRKVTRKDQVRA